jgi:hypothetical protein
MCWFQYVKLTWRCTCDNVKRRGCAKSVTAMPKAGQLSVNPLSDISYAIKCPRVSRLTVD